MRVKTIKIVNFFIIVLIATVLCSCDFLDSVKEKGGQIIDNVSEWSSDTIEKMKNKCIELYGTSKDSAIYVYEKTAQATKKTYDTAKQKAEELLDNADDYIQGLIDGISEEIKYSSYDEKAPIKDLAKNQNFNNIDSKVLTDTSIEDFIAYHISSDLASRGFNVYNGVAYFKDQLYGGLIFTKSEIFVSEDNTNVCSAGFLQLVDKGYSGKVLTDEDVDRGVVAVSTATCGEETKKFIIDEYALINSYSGIFNNKYFKYEQRNNFTIDISIKNNEKKYYDKTIELYDFDNGKVINSKNNDDTMSSLYFKDKLKYLSAENTVNAIADFEESNPNDGGSTVIVLDGECVNKLNTGSDTENYSFAEEVCKNSETQKINNGQCMNITSKASTKIFGIANSIDAEKTSDGLLSIINSGLDIYYSTAAIIVGVSAGVVIVKAVVITTATLVILYNVSSLLENAQNVYYGINKNDATAPNPIYSILEKAIKDEKTAKLVYNIWGLGKGIGCNGLKRLNKKLKLAKNNGCNVHFKPSNVIGCCLKLCATTLSKKVIPNITSWYADRVKTRVSGDSNIGRLSTFGNRPVTTTVNYNYLNETKDDLSQKYSNKEILSYFNKTIEGLPLLLLNSTNKDSQRGQVEATVYYLVNEACKYYDIEKIPTIEVYYDSNTSVCGQYVSDKNLLKINLRSGAHQSIDGLIDTIGHEIGHAYQYQHLNDNPNSDISISLKNYIYSDQNYNSYRNQACEKDAFNNASYFVKFIKNKMN